MDGKFAFIPVSFSLYPTDACGNYGFDCPVEANQLEKLQLNLPIFRGYPTLSLDARLNMVDEQGRVIVCVKFPAKIVLNPQGTNK